MTEPANTFPEMENTALYTAILERGTFYFPAGAHYGNPDAKVICDRCKRSGIPACIGFERNDLCLPCAEVVALRTPVRDLSDRLSILRPIRDPTPHREYVTLMLQDMYGAPQTRMMHDMFRR